MSQRLTTCLWFEANAEQAVDFYLSVFPGGHITASARYGDAGPGPAGSVMTIAFEFAGQSFLALNGGPHYKITPAISLIVNCDSQDEIDSYWRRLSDGGSEGRCGWLTDRFGVSWQIVPRAVQGWMTSGDERAARVMKAVFKMNKIDIAVLQKAFNAEEGSVQ